MCKPSPTFRRRNQTSLLLKLDSFHCLDEKGEKGPVSPSLSSTLISTAVLVVFLFANEHFCQYLFELYLKPLHSIFEVEKNRLILARHIAVDTFSCTVVAYLGWQTRRLLSDVTNHYINKRGPKFDEKDFDRRIYGYCPASQQILLFFFAFQVKNLYDTLKWNDGPLFIFHHILALVAAWCGMYPGVCHIYGVFFMGISEISTAVLCILANFDPDFGVSGLEDAFPITKIVLAAIFAVSFIICRTILWPVFTYHFLLDARNALERNSAKETTAAKIALRFLMICVSGLTILQVAWLGEIFITARKEILKLI